MEKKIAAETIPEMGRGRKKENGGGVNTGMKYLIYFKNLCKCHNVPTPSTIKNK
jgi:hypothetical protein